MVGFSVLSVSRDAAEAGGLKDSQSTKCSILLPMPEIISTSLGLITSFE